MVTPKKKKTRNSVATKKEILQAAIEVFVKRGFTRASLEEIAVEAGVTRGAVYWHFENKHDIFEALQDELYCPLTTSILQDMEKKCDDSLAQLEKLCVKLLTDLDEDETRKKILQIFFCKCDYSCGMDDILAKQRAQKLKNIKIFSQYFELAKKKKLLAKDVDPHITAISLACYMTGLVVEYLRNPQLFKLKQQAKLLMKQFFVALRVK